MIEFPCWGCGKTLKTTAGVAGKKCKCTKCDRLNTIPPIQDAMSVSNDLGFPELSEDPVELKPNARGVVVHLVGIIVTWSLAMVRIAAVLMLITCILALVHYMFMDTTVSKHGEHVPAYANPRVHNLILAQEQNAGIMGSGIGAGICIGILAILKNSYHRKI